MIREIQPEVIVNASAYTAVDKAESEAELAMTINGLAPGKLAQTAAELKQFLFIIQPIMFSMGRKAAPILRVMRPTR